MASRSSEIRRSDPLPIILHFYSNQKYFFTFLISGKKRKAEKLKTPKKSKTKKLKADSDLSEPEIESDEPKRISSRKSRKLKDDQPVSDPKPVSDNLVEDRPPTVAEVCQNFGLNDVDLVIISSLYRIYFCSF